MSTTSTQASTDLALVRGILRRVSSDLGMMLGQDVRFEEPTVERASARPAGEGPVHVSFKLAFTFASGAERHGALLVPLPEAITMACLLLMLPEDSLAARRADPAPDAALKAAMLEIGSMVGTATNAAFDELGLACTARSTGCQGVRAGVRPAFPYREGEELVVGRAQASVHTFSPFEALLVLPAPE